MIGQGDGPASPHRSGALENLCGALSILQLKNSIVALFSRYGSRSIIDAHGKEG